MNDETTWTKKQQRGVYLLDKEGGKTWGSNALEEPKTNFFYPESPVAEQQWKDNWG